MKRYYKVRLQQSYLGTHYCWHLHKGPTWAD